MQENTYEKAAGNTPESSQSENSFGENDDRLSKILEKLDLKGTESWTEQQVSQKALKGISTPICSEFKGVG